MTKADLVEYYRRVADVMLPHVQGRPAMLSRYPDGIDGHGFYQKEASEHFPDWVRRVELAKEGGTVNHVVTDDAATLTYLAGQASITPHTWLSRADRPNHPDRLVIEVGLVPFVRTTGSRGLHVVSPLDRSAACSSTSPATATPRRQCRPTPCVPCPAPLWPPRASPS